MRIFFGYLFTSDFLRNFSVPQRFMCFVGILTRGVWVVRATGMCSDIVCARSRFRTDDSECNHFLWPRVLQSPYRASVRHGTHRMVVWSDSPSSSTDCTDWPPARNFKQATGPESSGDEFGIFEDDRCFGTGVFQQRYFLHELVFACSQPPPQQPQISYTIRTVARCELGLLPVVSTLWKASTRVLVRSVVPELRYRTSPDRVSLGIF